MTINHETPVKVAEQQLRDAGKLAKWEQMHDDEYAKYCLEEFSTVDEILTFVDSLPDTCHKKLTANDYLRKEHGFWVESPKRAKTALAVARRTCCRCHRLGSFTKDERFGS